jgi:hypothetical protein
MLWFEAARRNTAGDQSELNRLGADNPIQVAAVSHKNSTLQARTLAMYTEACVAAPSTKTQLLSCLTPHVPSLWAFSKSRKGPLFKTPSLHVKAV